MASIPRLRPGAPFPPTSRALDYPSGLLAVGGELSPERLVEAYRQGIFPWYEPPQPVLWWTPEPRAVLFPEQLHVARSLRRTLRRGSYRVCCDRDFSGVMSACAAPRQGVEGTWITGDMLRAYTALHRRGLAHSVELRDAEDQLVGGLYGVALGQAFFGESMFSRVPSASRIALVALTRILSLGGYRLLDCQVESAHLSGMGATTLSRLDFEALLAQTVEAPADSSVWAFEANCGELLT